MKAQLLALAVSALLLAPVSAQGVFTAKVDLKRCMIGNQAGLLKVLSLQRKVLFTRGIDDRDQARMDEASRSALLSALNIEPAQYANVADQLMRDWNKLPRKEAIAVISTIAASPDFAASERVETFLVGVMKSSNDIYARRQAVLGLAVLPRVRPETVAAVVARYETCQNLWETFPIQQFFEYHAAEIRGDKDFSDVRGRLAAVKSLYTPAVLGYLDT
ncbi:MAG: hypothetical protein KF760_23635 [Candidatus Eremiobacteraeota bacterium]|nr:hypothetical protein [Candidatus Eremiobacteraeota bacterium]MCW5866217.1 hypothetical protein [Candidatus Eremiobacteraeota bacterium]